MKWSWRLLSGRLLAGVFVFLVTVLTWQTPLFAADDSLEKMKHRGKVPAEVLNELTAGKQQDLIVEFDVSAVVEEAAAMRSEKGVKHDSPEIRGHKAQRYRETKSRVFSSLSYEDVEQLKDYNHLPLTYVQIRSLKALDKLIEHSDVKRIHRNEVNQKQLINSLPLINQPQASNAGYKGERVTVAVLDTGVDYTRGAFGSNGSSPGCAGPGKPGCSVVYASDIGTSDSYLDDDGHGTNVAGIVLGVAPDAWIAALDVFIKYSDGSIGAPDAYILGAIDWCIAYRDYYNIVAMNMSLGGGKYYSPCADNVFSIAVAQAREAGILTVAASGNSYFSDSLCAPACVPGVVSVGAVYDCTFTGAGSSCRDSQSVQDEVTPFSNSAQFLTILAPGAIIDAVGIPMQGTSQASPHVAGAVAALRSAFPDDSLDEIVARMTDNGIQVFDRRNGVFKPRLDLVGAVTGVKTLKVLSADAKSGAMVTVTPADMTGQGGGVTELTRRYNSITTVTMTAAAKTQNGRPFSGWSGCDSVNGRVCTVTLSTSRNVSVLYGTLTDTLDSIYLTWVTGGDAPWSSELATPDARDVARSGAISNGQKSWIETSITGPVRLFFSWKVSSEKDFDFMKLYLDRIEKKAVSGDVDWRRESIDIPAGTHQLRWEYRKSATNSSLLDAGWLDRVELAPPNTSELTVTCLTMNDGVSIELNPPDKSGRNVTSTSSSVIYNQGTTVTLTAPAMAGGAYFIAWRQCDTVSGRSCVVRLDKSRTVETVYSAFSIADAADTTTMTWRTGGDVPWSGQSIVTSDGIDAVQSGRIDTFQRSWLETDVTGPGYFYFSWSVSSELNYDYLKLYLDRHVQKGISGSSGWLREKLAVPPGSHTIRWEYMKDSVKEDGTDAAYIDKVSMIAGEYLLTVLSANPGVGVPITLNQVDASGGSNGATPFVRGYASGAAITLTAPQQSVSGAFAGWINCDSTSGRDCTVNMNADKVVRADYTISLPQALDRSDSVTWTTGGDALWFGQSTVSSDGIDAARSSVMTDNQKSWLKATLTGPAKLVFSWKVSSEASDYLNVYLDGSSSPSFTISGNVDWTERVLTIPAGIHDVRWEYAKDGYSSSGDDTGYLDMIRIIPGDVLLKVGGASGVPITVIPADQSGAADGVAPLYRGYVSGSTVTLTAPSVFNGFPFSKWIGCGSVNDRECFVTLFVDKTVIPVYEVSLGSALDNASLVWSTGGDAFWFGQNGYTFDGLDAARSGVIGDSKQSWIMTEVTGPALLKFYWKVSSEKCCDYFIFLIDDLQKKLISGAKDWAQELHYIPAGGHTLKWLYTKDSSASTELDAGFLDNVIITPVPPISLGEALNAPTLIWNTGGDATWYPDSTRAVSGDIGDQQTSWVETTLNGGVMLTFNWGISSEVGNDVLRIYLDGYEQQHISGSVSNVTVSIPIPVGVHTIQWEYRKNGSTSVGTDNAWISNVTLHGYKLAVKSFTPGGAPLIDVGVSDLKGMKNGIPTFERFYHLGEKVTLTAPQVVGNSILTQWLGCDAIEGTTCVVEIDRERTILLSYADKAAQLTVSLKGRGSGSVNSDPFGIQCVTGSCPSAYYAAGTPVCLYALPVFTAFFDAWAGGGCSGMNTCCFTIKSNTSVTATFDPIPAKAKIRNAEYPSLQSAFNAARNNDEILATRADFVEQPILGNGASITLRGGYDYPSYSSRSNYSVLHGKLEIKQGSVVVDGLIIQ